MSIRLADRRKCPPNGFLYHEKRTGWKNWEVDPTSVWDFALCVERYREHALANPGLALETDPEKIANMLDFANAMRCLGIAGADQYVVRTSAVPKPMAPQPQPAQVLPSRPGVVGHVKNLNAGRKTLTEWWGEGGVPVSNELAEQRAAVCVDCPQNLKSGLGLLARFTREAASVIHSTIEEARQQKLQTSKDDELNVCEACDCPLVLKVHTPLKHILAHQTQEVNMKLDKRCWIISEAAL